MIPKKIHYIWLGDKPKPALVLKCLDSWRKNLPDYEIIEWGNDAISHIDNQYLQEAFYHQKWAFASDILRLHILYHQGGIYLDTDVEVRNSFDPFLQDDFFTGHELHKDECYPVVTAVLGSTPQNKIIKELLALYDHTTFIINNRLDLTPNTIRVTQYLEQKFNLAPPYEGKTKIQLTENSYIYPYYYFCTPRAGEPNYSIHLFDGSWIPGFARRDKFSLLGVSLTRFKRIANNDILDIGLKDRVICSINISKNVKYALILNKKS